MNQTNLNFSRPRMSLNQANFDDVLIQIDSDFSITGFDLEAKMMGRGLILNDPNNVRRYPAIDFAWDRKV